MAGRITLTLTPMQAKVLWNTVDGAADAGACEDGNTPVEAQALRDIMEKMLPHVHKWKGLKL